MKSLRAHCTYFALLAATICGDTSVALALASPDPQQKLLSLTVEARAAYSSGQFALAEQKYGEAIKLTSSATPAKARVALLSNLGAAYREDRKYIEAEDAFKKALVIAEAAHLNYDYSAKLTMQQYAMLLRKMKRLKEADAMDLRSVAGLADRTEPKNAPAEGPKLVAVGKAPNAVADSNDIVELRVDVQQDFSKASVDELKKRVTSNPQNWRLMGQLGAKMMEENDFTESAEQFKAALRCADDATPKQKSQLRYFMAEAYLRADQPQEALEAFRQLCADNPNDSKFCRLMAVCYEMMGDMPSALAAYELHMSRWPNDSHNSEISENVTRMKRDIASVSQQAAQSDNKPTLNELKKSFIHGQMPLKVWINDKDEDRITLAQSKDSAVTENTPGLLIQRALEQWTQASQGRITFSLVSKMEDADITCEFTEDPNGLEAESALGITIPHIQAGSRHTSEIKLLVVQPQSGEPLDRGSFAQAAVHEFGHALGLEHSDRTGDVMYRSVGMKPVVFLSDNDKDRIQKLYTYTP